MCLFFVFSIDFALNYKTSNVNICAQIQYKANTFNKSEMQDKLEKKRCVHPPAVPPPTDTPKIGPKTVRPGWLRMSLLYGEFPVF